MQQSSSVAEVKETLTPEVSTDSLQSHSADRQAQATAFFQGLGSVVRKVQESRHSDVGPTSIISNLSTRTSMTRTSTTSLSRTSAFRYNFPVSPALAKVRFRLRPFGLPDQSLSRKLTTCAPSRLDLSKIDQYRLIALQSHKWQDLCYRNLPCSLF